MKKTIQYLIFLLTTVLMFGCSGGAYYKNLGNGYYLSAINIKEDMNFGVNNDGYEVGMINATVFAVGQLDNYVIVKQHPRNFPDKPDKSVTNYYIIPLKIKISKSPETNFYGPMNLKQFEIKTDSLKLKEILYQYRFKDLE